MGLRSRQRRRAGIVDTIDPETTQRTTDSLEDHLRASIRHVDAFNLAWKHAVATGGLAIVAFEAYLLLQLFISSSGAGLTPLRFAACLALKVVAIASVICTRAHVQRGHPQAFPSAVVVTGSYFVVYTGCLALLDDAFTAAQVSPLCVVYFALSAAVLRLVGGNTRAEVARAEQLAKLEQQLKR